MPDTVRHFTHLCSAKMHIHTLSYPHSRKRALHFRRMAKTSHCASNASRRTPSGTSRIFAPQRCTSISHHIHTCVSKRFTFAIRRKLHIATAMLHAGHTSGTSRIFAPQRCTTILYHIHTRKASASLSPHGENFTLRKQCFTPDTRPALHASLQSKDAQIPTPLCHLRVGCHHAQKSAQRLILDLPDPLIGT